MSWLMISGWGMDTRPLEPLAGPSDAIVCWDQAEPPEEPSWVLGWSLGGVIAADMVDHPNVLGVVTLCTPSHFQSQVDERFFKRLRRGVEQNPQAALAGFADWLLPDAPIDWQRPECLVAGLDRLWCSDLCTTPGIHRIEGLSDPLFASTDPYGIPGDHQLPFTRPQVIRAQLDRWADAV